MPMQMLLPMPLINIGDSIEYNEPNSYQEACSSKYKTNWLKAMKEVMETLQKNNT